MVTYPPQPLVKPARPGQSKPRINIPTRQIMTSQQTAIYLLHRTSAAIQGMMDTASSMPSVMVTTLVMLGARGVIQQTRAQSGSTASYQAVLEVSSTGVTEQCP